MRHTLIALAVTAFLFALVPRAEAAIETDFVFVLNATGGMTDELAHFKTGISDFLDDLPVPQVSARYAIVLFGGAPELVLDFTSNKTAVLNAFNDISTSGAVTGFQEDHSTNPAALQEAIRIVLGVGTFEEADFRANVGGAGALEFREGARINIVAVTNGDSDLPFYFDNRESGQTGTNPPIPVPPATLDAAWQAEVDSTAAALIAKQAFLNLIMNRFDPPSTEQLGDSDLTEPDPDGEEFDPEATLAALIDAGLGDSLQAQLLEAGLLARTFNVAELESNEQFAAFVARFFGSKVQEVLNDPGLAVIPEPASICVWTVLGALGAGAGWWRRHKRRARKRNADNGEISTDVAVAHSSPDQAA